MFQSTLSECDTKNTGENHGESFNDRRILHDIVCSSYSLARLNNDVMCCLINRLSLSNVSICLCNASSGGQRIYVRQRGPQHSWEWCPIAADTVVDRSGYPGPVVNHG